MVRVTSVYVKASFMKTLQHMIWKLTTWKENIYIDYSDVVRLLNILRVLHHNKNSCFFLNLNFRNNCFHLSAFPFEKYSVFIFRNLSLKTQYNIHILFF